MKKKINKKILLIFIVLVILTAGFIFYFFQGAKEEPLVLTEPESKRTLKLTSPAFENGQLIPVRYSCHGEGINPPFQISGVPEETKSLTLIVVDADAPYGVFTHWVLWNISSSTSFIEENSLPEGGMQGTNSFGEQSYGAPCPSKNESHHYYFLLSALDKELDLDSSSEKRDVERVMCRHTIDWAELIGLYP